MHQIAPDTGIVLHSKLFHILCITIIYSRYIIIKPYKDFSLPLPIQGFIFEE